MAAPTPDWPSFHAYLMATYWPCLPPADRVESRPGAAPGDPEVPTDIWQAALMIFPHVEGWLANPIPNLGRRTPLQVLAAGEADAIRAILMEVGPFMLPDPSTVEPWSDD